MFYLVSLSSELRFITTISAFTQPGCKDKNKDPHAGDRDDGFKDGLPNWCNTKKASAIFFWFAWAFWTASLVLIVMDWRSGKANRPRDPPFEHPADEDYDDEDEESSYHPTNNRQSTYDAPAADSPFSDNNRYSASNPVPPSIPPISFTSTPPPAGFSSPTNPRPSMDVYGAFSDPAPSGYSPGGIPPAQSPPQQESARLSRTMQYADPYAAIRATINPAPQSPTQAPPSYSFEGRY